MDKGYLCKIFKRESLRGLYEAQRKDGYLKGIILLLSNEMTTIYLLLDTTQMSYYMELLSHPVAKTTINT